MATEQAQEWERLLRSLDGPRRAQALALRETFARLGADAPEEWAASEVTEDVPQLARYLALRRLWPDLIDTWAEPGGLESVPAGRRLLESGADRAELALLARNVAYDTVFALLYRFSAAGRDTEAPDTTPGWALVETGPDSEPTGRELGSLHEDVLTMDPSGDEGADLFD